MNAITAIKSSLNAIPTGKPFSAHQFYALSTTANIRQILSRQVKAGELKRVCRGIFVKPKKSKLMGSVLPPTEELIESIASITGETIAIHGAEAARQLQLTTQVPMKPIYYTSGYSRTMHINHQAVELKHISLSKLALAGTLPGLVISALSYVGKEHVSKETLKKLHHQLGEKAFNKLKTATQHMPGWMVNHFYRFWKQQEDNGL